MINVPTQTEPSRVNTDLDLIPMLILRGCLKSFLCVEIECTSEMLSSFSFD